MALGVATEMGLNAWLTVLLCHNFRPFVMFLEDLVFLPRLLTLHVHG
jgi:hypothetical protein